MKRLFKLVLGLFLFAVGIYLSVRANVGLAPWDAFHQGLALVTGIEFGTVLIISGVVILIFNILLKEKIGLGTLLNIFLIGAFFNLLNAMAIVPLIESFFIGIPVLLLGQFIICLGSWLYMGAAFGSGPRDALMVAVKKRLPRVPVGAIRASIEGLALLIGWLLGAKVGAGTVIAVFGIGFVLQFTFKLLSFDVSAVRHEDLFDTYKSVRAFFKK